MKVMIADDDPIVRHFIVASVESLGHKAVSFPDGKSALAAMDSFAPNVVVSDWKMPGIDGLELCRRIRELKGSSIYFILISSALGSLKSTDQAWDAGVDAMLPKPMGFDEIWSALRLVEHVAV